MPLFKGSKLGTAYLSESLILSMSPSALEKYLKMKTHFTGKTLTQERASWNKMVAETITTFRENGLNDRLTPEAIAAHQTKIKKQNKNRIRRAKRRLIHNTSGNPRGEPENADYRTREFTADNGDRITIRERNWEDGR
jgi:hypothetical protein